VGEREGESQYMVTGDWASVLLSVNPGVW